MFLTNILDVSRIKVPLVSTTKEGVIAELIDVLKAAGDISDRDRALTAVLDRERTRTTGIGNALAIPHGKTNAVGGMVMALGKTEHPVEFGSIDNKPVHLVIMILSPLDQTGPHIQALAHVTRLLIHDAFRSKLLAAASAQEMHQAIAQQEAAGREG